MYLYLNMTTPNVEMLDEHLDDTILNIEMLDDTDLLILYFCY